MSFLSFESPHYAAMVSKWRLTRAFYTGEGAAGHLLMHRMGESPSAFQERTELAHWHPLVADVIDSLAGLLFEKEDEVARDWGGLGSPDTDGTVAHRIWTDCDAAGTNYSTLLRKFAIQVLLHQELFCLVDAPVGSREARIRLIPPIDVPNYLPDLSQVVVKESVDARTSLTEKPELQTQYVVYAPDQWTRYRKTTEGREVAIQSGAYSDTGRIYVNRHGDPTPPIFRVKLPFERLVAHQLAESARVIFNAESDRDSLVRAASYPKLVLSADDDLYDKLVGELRKGSNVLQRDENYGDHAYIAPPVAGVQAATDVLDRKIKRFYEAAWRLYDSEGKIHQTATGAALDRSSGLASALAMVASTLEEFETMVLWLLAQSYSDRPADWQKVSVAWPTNYTVVGAGPVGPAA